MLKRLSPRAVAALQALFVTFLWSISFLLVKIGLKDVPALTFAGLRYSLAGFCLLLLALSRPKRRAALRQLTRRDWAWLIVLGLVFYTITQGAVFVGLDYLPSATVSLLLNFTSILTAFFGIIFLAERPTRLQWGGSVLAIVGALVYFYPVAVPEAETVGFIAVGICVFSNVGASVIGRRINRAQTTDPLTVTAVSMGIGAVVLLGIGAAVQGIPPLRPTSWIIIAWLAVVNTALAFTLWNHTLRTLSAMESSIINNTMLIQIAVLAWLFLGEGLSGQAVVGIALVALGTLAVQVRK